MQTRKDRPSPACKADVDLVAHTADVTYLVEPGPLAVSGEVRIEGLGDLPEDVVRRALAIKPGAPYSTEIIEDARTSVLDLGTFSNVDIQPDLSGSKEATPVVVPLNVSAERTKLRALRLSGGIELDLIRTDVHLGVGYDHANFLGGFRRLTLDFRPRLASTRRGSPRSRRPRATCLRRRPAPSSRSRAFSRGARRAPCAPSTTSSPCCSRRYVLQEIERYSCSLIFTNTRAQCEMWYQALLEKKPEWAGEIALHHSSLDADARQWVEAAVKSGKLRAVICTTSLDLGVDFSPVEKVFQIGSPKERRAIITESWTFRTFSRKSFTYYFSADLPFRIFRSCCSTVGY